MSGGSAGKELMTNLYYHRALSTKKTGLQSEAQIQQIQAAGGSHSVGMVLHAGDLKMDLDRCLLWKAHKEIHLTPKEFDLLSYLFKNQGALVSHVKLLRAVWGPEYGNELEYLRNYVRSLRKKIEDDPAKPRYILTESWRGYRFWNPSDPGAHAAAGGFASLNCLSVVHDLRNPLATICAGTEILVQPDLTSANVRRLAGNIRTAAVRMRVLLSYLFSDLRGDPALIGVCDLREVIVAAADSALATRKPGQVHVLFGVPKGIMLHLERSPVERVFFNVIENAIEAMPHGGRINICEQKTVEGVLIAVEDTGPGIPDHVRDRLFEPFVTYGKPDGLGLGLALARQMLRSRGGDIWTEPAKGARFVIRLPAERTQRAIA
jgi:DNA-binding winged helix-turn-helix (wHTH) protein